MSDFSQKKCQACQGFSEKIASEDALIFLRQVPKWQLRNDGLAIIRRFNFKNFKQTMFFINAVAFLCEREGHHPDAHFSYNFCEIAFTTHELGGLSENDFICAAKVDQLLNN
jgi:4a-hydroxytetrahydrobiopterin dehydratase